MVGIAHARLLVAMKVDAVMVSKASQPGGDLWMLTGPNTIVSHLVRKPRRILARTTGPTKALARQMRKDTPSSVPASCFVTGLELRCAVQEGFIDASESLPSDAFTVRAN